MHSNSKRSTAERNLQGPGGGPILTDVYEESLSTQIQGMVVIQRINVSLIQSSVVEEVISFAALDNVQVIIDLKHFIRTVVSVYGNSFLGFELCFIVGGQFRRYHIKIPFRKDNKSIYAYRLYSTNN